MREKWTGNDGMLQALAKENLRQAPGTKFVYSDINFIVLGEIVKRISGKEINVFFEENLFNQVKMISSGFRGVLNNTDLPKQENRKQRQTLGGGMVFVDYIEKIAPTENIKGQQSYLGGEFEGKDGDKILRGEVHDPTSYRMGGVAGHAGLFSTADDLARYCQMILNGGTLDGVRVMSAESVATMTKPRVVSETGQTRGLGWDMNTAFSGNRGELFPLGSFGHTGFTGTGIWIDRVSQTFVVFMSNRVHPDGKGDVSPIRNKIATIAASAVEDTPIEAYRLAESVYASQVAEQVQSFKSKIQSLNAKGEGQRTKDALVLNGIDVLEKENFKSLENLKIGLVTNQTGRDRSGRQTIDVLNEAKNLKLVALFSPEHGIRGLADEKVSDSKDEKTGLPIYSLYGETRRPKPEQLKDVDVVVFDIQDVGTRFYTFTSTLLNVMEEAAKAGKPVFVLDRPNPINGVDIEGAVADADKLSFVAAYTLPVRHAMTLGEIAQMYNHEKKLNCDLRVVKMDGWQRNLWFDETNQMWTNPSPNMRSLTQATLYPGIGLLETTNLSVGRGTDTPFEIVGAPYIDAVQLAQYLNNRNIAGASFVPRRFTPAASVFKGEECGGVNVIITNRNAFKSVRTGLEIAVALRRLYPTEWKVDDYARLLANSSILEKVKQADAPEEIEKFWQNDLDAFKKRRAQFLLY